MNILINDGISTIGGRMLQEAGFKLYTQNVPQDKLVQFMNKNHIEILLVRGATQVTMDVIEDVPSLKLIGRGGSGTDNIDINYAEQMGIRVINTPLASSQSVAELAFAHLLGLARNLHDANRNMPLEGDIRFSDLKRSYANSVELKGKTLGIVGYGRIGRSVAKIAIAMGMRVVGVWHKDHKTNEDNLTIKFFDEQSLTFKIPLLSFEEVLKESDFITLHVPEQEKYLIDEVAISKMKDGVIILNLARGGVIDEVALVKAIEEGKVRSAALDVFEREPSPELQVLMHPQLSLSPHIGGTTIDAQERIGKELAEQIITIFGKQRKLNKNESLF